MYKRLSVLVLPLAAGHLFPHEFSVTLSVVVKPAGLRTAVCVCLCVCQSVTVANKLQNVCYLLIPSLSPYHQF